MDELPSTNPDTDDDVAGHALPAIGAVLAGALAKDYVAYAVCFYPAWIGSGDAVTAGDHCHDRYVSKMPSSK